MRHPSVPPEPRCSCVCAQPLGHAGDCDNASAIAARAQLPPEPDAPIAGAPYPDKLPARELATGDEEQPLEALVAE